MQKTPIIIVDDHLLFSQALSGLVNKFDTYKVIAQLGNGQELIDYFKLNNEEPAIVLMDVNMPILDGIEANRWLKKNKPGIKVLALTMNDDEVVIIKMLRAGACGYLLKDIHPKVLLEALNQIMIKGVYYTDEITETLIRAKKTKPVEFKNREFEFLELACTDLTYKKIAEQMFLSYKTIDGYRDAIFDKFNVSNRIGMVLYALKEKLVEL